MRLPDITFYMRERDETLGGDNPFKWVLKTTKDIFAGKRVLIIGLPGAFTPTCSNSQLPGFDAMFEQFQEKGIDEIWCTAVNDAFVMYQWAQHQGTKHVKMLPDGNGAFAQSLGMLVDKSNLGFGSRSWRYVALVNDLTIENMFIEDQPMHYDPTDPYEVSTPENVYLNL